MSSIDLPSSRVPVATYRLQFNHVFTFKAATQIVPYLSALGITDCYASSYLKAVPGSMHGYDIIDPTVFNPEVGSEGDYRAWVAALQHHGLGQILDVVPNHMGIGQSLNQWWRDVLENGPNSRFAEVFDIDWRPLKRELEGKVLLPILSDLYGVVLENQEIQLVYEGRFHIQYYEHRLPVAPQSWPLVLTYRLDKLLAHAAAERSSVDELQSIVTALRHLPSRMERNPERIREYYREKGIAERRLVSLLRESPAIAKFLEENVRLFNGTAHEPDSFQLLDQLLNEQAYRLAYWRVASEEINYRRFFDINELAAIRMEEEAVFKAAHALIFQLLQDGILNGLRIDHVDGLYDPGQYLQRLQEWARTELPAQLRLDQEERPLYLIVEKILSPDEPLPEAWPVYGTTGYDFLNLLNGLFVNAANAQTFDDLHTRFSHHHVLYEDLVHECKQLIMRASMSSEINVLGHQLNLLSERDRRSRDFTLNSLTQAIREIIACFPVYRTYVTDGPDPVTERDRAYLRRAVAQAKRRNPAVTGLVFDFVRSLLLKEWDARTTEDRQAHLRFLMKFQQITSPVTAKGIEDTAYYRYNRLLSLNEVGADAQQFGTSLADFHQWMRERQAYWPYALSATSTHDTKRSEDVRARLNILSEMPHEWKSHVTLWAKINNRYKTLVEGEPVPDANEEYGLYQTLVGAWPLGDLDEPAYRTFCARIQNYMNKALKEAKDHTSWLNVDHPYEEAVHHFVDAILECRSPNSFLDDFIPFQRRISVYGMCNALAQVILKVTAPGIPDFYQGTELWDLSLVDPDNRQPVDFLSRARLLSELEQACSESGDDRRQLVRDLITTRVDGRLKLYITRTILHYRCGHAQLFQRGEYIPLEAYASRKDHVCAFTRLYQDDAVVTVVPRLVAGLMQPRASFPVGEDVWADTVVKVPSWRAGSRYLNLLTGEILASREEAGVQILPLAEILSDCPVAMLERLT